ncbi:hypothetical protein TNCV_4050931 [Trichonephila clavipes]|nr:hypothetical protein TNCV_4050931 [Trichonephila clavipes]
MSFDNALWKAAFTGIASNTSWSHKLKCDSSEKTTWSQSASQGLYAHDLIAVAAVYDPPIIEIRGDSVPEPDEIDDYLMIEEVVDLFRKINLESDDGRDLLDSRNQELTIHLLLQGQEQDIEELSL